MKRTVFFRSVVSGHDVVLFMIGYTHNSIVHNGMFDRGVRLISKPFTVNDHRRELRAALAGRRASAAPD